MITETMYQDYLKVNGSALGDARRKHSEEIMDATFTGDVGYKRVYVLDPQEGWHWTDAKYSQHLRQSISSDDVDYYLQFRPHEHHPIGTYIFVPNEDDTEIGFFNENPDNPFDDLNFQEIFDQGKLWMIVGKNQSKMFVRYMILGCNWDFKWIDNYQGRTQILHCYGINRVLSSYTAGTWEADYMRQLDTVSGVWLPDTYYIFKDKIKDYDLCDTRYLRHDCRVMLTTNIIYPQVYRLTKIVDMFTLGLLKFTLKQDEYDPRRDEPSLMLCDYYNLEGKQVTATPPIDEPNQYHVSIIHDAVINENDELETSLVDTPNIQIGVSSYYMVTLSNTVDFLEWKISYSSNNDDYESITKKKKSSLEKMIAINVIDDLSINLELSKAKSLVGKKFILSVQDNNGDYYSERELEVVA